MNLFDALKVIHVSCALLSVTGFALRGYWALTENPRLVQRPVRVLPHMIDTLLLGSAVGMLVIWQVSPVAVPWLAAKLVALVAYILFGMVALRFARTCRERLVAYAAALCTAGYILCAAVTHSALGPLAALG